MKSQYKSICLTETKPSINNIKAKERNVSPPLVTELGIQSQRISEIEARLVHRTIFRTARATWTNIISKNLQTRRFKQQVTKLPYHRISLIYTEFYVTLL